MVVHPQVRIPRQPDCERLWISGFSEAFGFWTTPSACCSSLTVISATFQIVNAAGMQRCQVSARVLRRQGRSFFRGFP